MDVEIGDMIFIYDETSDKIKGYEIKSINKETYRVEKNWGKQLASFTIQKDEENKSWFPSYASALSFILDNEYKNIKRLKRNIEQQIKRLEEIKTRHSRHKIIPQPKSDMENSS